MGTLSATLRRLHRNAANSSMRSELQSPEQLLGIIEVGRAHHRREPVVNRLEQRARLLVPALAMPEAGKTDGDAQFPQATVLAPRHGQRLAKAVFGLRRSGGRQQQISA